MCKVKRREGQKKEKDYNVREWKKKGGKAGGGREEREETCPRELSGEGRQEDVH